MKNKSAETMWQYSEAADIRSNSRFVLLALIFAGFIMTIRLGNWWFKEDHIGSWPLFILLSVILWWAILRMLILWISYLKIDKPARILAPEGLKVAIYTTSSPGEPLSMFEKTLEACAQIRYPHTTYLLDDTQDDRFREVAEKHGAVWMKLVGIPGAKAGKINAALDMTSEEFILVLDPDHIPFPNFLDEVLGYFNDTKVGFVQVSQSYYNQYRSFTARGAAEQTYTFYGPTQMAMFGHQSAVAIGANCTFRRKALQSIGGHGIGLSEDLVTSIRMHAEGWKSVYTPIVVSRGLVPEDFGSYCRQQLKWARGVYEVLFAELPRLFRKLSFWQKLTYFMIGTYYVSGLSALLFMIIPFFYFWFHIIPVEMYFVHFLQYWLPVALIGVAIYMYVQQWLCDPESERGLHWRGSILKFAAWPVFIMGLLFALVDRKIPYIPTAKRAKKGISAFARPMIIHVVTFALTLTLFLGNRLYLTPEADLALSSEETWGMIFFAWVAFCMSVGGLYAAYESRNLSVEDPWMHKDAGLLNKIQVTWKKRKR
ncbi:MAG: glycosyltransferase family 2 protein [Bacteroidia bacterium]